MTHYTVVWRYRNGSGPAPQPFLASSAVDAQRKARVMAKGGTHIELAKWDGEPSSHWRDGKAPLARWKFNDETHEWSEYTERGEYDRRIREMEETIRRARAMLVTVDAVTAALTALGVSAGHADPRDPDGLYRACWEWSLYRGEKSGLVIADLRVRLEVGGSMYDGRTWVTAPLDLVRWELEGDLLPGPMVWSKLKKLKGSARLSNGRVEFPTEIAALIRRATGAVDSREEAGR